MICRIENQYNETIAGNTETHDSELFFEIQKWVSNHQIWQNKIIQ